MQLVRLIPALAFACASLAPAVRAQTSGQVDLRLEVLPAALRVTVTSAALDFGRQRADAGRVELDPATGEISAKAAGSHRLGEVRLTGPAHGGYALFVEPAAALRRGGQQVAYRLRWARSQDCASGAFEEVRSAHSSEGSLGAAGCSAYRFGGAIDLFGIAEGHYTGRLHVRILSL